MHGVAPYAGPLAFFTRVLNVIQVDASVLVRVAVFVKAFVHGAFYGQNEGPSRHFMGSLR